jgi:hypothetical protein
MGLSGIFQPVLREFPATAWRRSSCRLSTIVGLVLVPAWLAGFGSTGRAEIYIDKNYPIQGRDGISELSPPNIEATSDCSTHVYVDSFVPQATIHVWLKPTTGPEVIIGSATPKPGFAAIALTHELHIGDKVTATQTVNGVTSAHSSEVAIDAIPPKLPAPTIDPHIYACGRVVPVHGLLSGVTVTVTDVTTNSPLGSGFTPNLWGSDWSPVGTSPLQAGHKVSAQQTACGKEPSPSTVSPVTVLTDPTTMNKPTLVPPIVGNDTITVDNLYIGALLQAENTAVTPAANLGGGYATAPSNWMELTGPLTATENVAVTESLCNDKTETPPQKPVASLDAPLLMEPICPGQPAVTVRNSVPNATLVLLKNGVVVGYGGAASGDVPLTIAPPNSFADNDTVEVVQYINAITSPVSNSVKVGCTNAVTYHYNNERTGWNDAERTLTPANVHAPEFRLLQSVPLDDQVDAQPLIVNQQKIEGKGLRDVAYVATENNTIYAIDAVTGAILLHPNFGTPVPQSALPGTCTNNTTHVGINSTPVIDGKAGTMYVVIYTYESGAPVYRLHALSLEDLVDKVPPAEINSTNTSNKLSDGSTWSFQPQSQRQRSALLLANGNVYAGFASFCDINHDTSRGWLLGWKAATLTPLAANELTDKQTGGTTPTGHFHDFYLSSIWMSGYGVAADSSGDLYFVTGNSDTVRANNIQESAVRMSPDLTGVKDSFTPYDLVNLDNGDLDFGSGGLMVLPDQRGPVPHLAAAAGKAGKLFLINRDAMGGFVAGGPDKPQSVDIVWCHCGPAYFVGSDGVSRVVSSGDTRVKTWKVDTSKPAWLTLDGTSASIFVSNEQDNTKPQDSGFFTAISSNGTQANTAIIWAVSRPDDTKKPTISLYAFNAATSGGNLPTLFSAPAGTWPSATPPLQGNANIVPVVANGRVYVASYKQLAIFGLAPPAEKKLASRATLIAAQLEAPAAPSVPEPQGSHFVGTIEKIDGNQLTVRLRSGDALTVDVTAALKASQSVVPYVGEGIAVTGTLTADGVLDARTMLRAKALASWGPDRR